jgi:hypothetical protein
MGHGRKSHDHGSGQSAGIGQGRGLRPRGDGSRSADSRTLSLPRPPILAVREQRFGLGHLKEKEGEGMRWRSTKQSFSNF